MPALIRTIAPTALPVDLDEVKAGLRIDGTDEQEWASLPFNNGRSFYAGDAHGNRSLVSRKEVMRVLQQIRDQQIIGN